jgi:hypothetical protein
MNEHEEESLIHKPQKNHMLTYAGIAIILIGIGITSMFLFL